MENTLENISKSVLDKLEHLKCPICLDIVESVRELPCRHIFCSNCLETYKKDKDILTCPLCKKETSKRKILSRDSALDTLCDFVKTLCDDVKLHHKSDIKTFFSNVFPESALNTKLTAIRESDEIIVESSEENIIPSTSRPIDKRKSVKKRNLNTSKLATKKAPDPIEVRIKKNSTRDEKKKATPKLGLPRKQNKTKVDSVNATVSNLKPQHRHSHDLRPDKNKILQWLHDTRNRFERFSQTQTYTSQNNTPQDIDLPSVSQIHNDKLMKDKKHKTVQEKQSTSNNNQHIEYKRTRSVENLPFECKTLRRHSLECTSPNKMKQYQNLQEMDNIENKLIIDIIEDEVLDVIDKEISGENNKKKAPLASKKSSTDYVNTADVNTKENEFLDQLDNEILENTIQPNKQFKGKKLDFNSSDVGKENKSKSSWKSIKKFKKTIGKTKVPKKLDISLQSTQRSNKKDTETKLNTSDKSPNKVVLENKTVDFHKMEDYFSKAIPQMMEKNIEETPPLETSDVDIGFKDNESGMKVDNVELRSTHEEEKDNDSEIYTYQTQPLSKEKIDPKIDKICYAARLTKKLDCLLQELTKEDKIQTSELAPLLPSIENIIKIFNNFENKIYSPKFHIENIQMKFSEKQIQTDLFSLDGFPITPNAAFKSLIHEDVGTQTDNFCAECPHLNPGKTTPKSPLITKQSSRESQKNGSSKKRTLTDSSIHFEENNSDVKSEINKASLSEENKITSMMSSKKQIESSSDKMLEIPKITSQKKLNFSNPTEERNRNNSILFDSQISVEQILEQCSTQLPNSSNISKMDQNKSALKIEESKNDDKSNATLGSALICSLPQSNSGVNRRLLFERTLKERSDLEQTLKRGRSENTSGSEDERPHKVKCNRFIQDNLSIEFESESLNINSQYIKNSDVQMTEINENHAGSRNKSMFCPNNENGNPTRTQNLGEITQADTLLNYCDDLIEKANRQISLRNVLPEHNNDTNLSQILSENTNNFRISEKINQSISRKHAEVKTQKTNEKIKTQDLLKHYDDLIDKANKQIEMESEHPSEPYNKKIQYNSSQIPTTSKNMDVFDEDDKDEDKKNVMKTQDLLDHCNALIEKTTKEIARNEIRQCDMEDKNNKVQSENDDDFFCQNLDQLDSVLEKENNRIVPSKEKLSESLFESCKENLAHEISVLERKAVSDMENTFSTPKRRKINNKEETEKKSNVSHPNKSDGFNSSDDEIFSDADMVETTPQKTLSFAERISCSQVVNQNSRMSMKIQESMEQFPSSMDIVPPPPGFDDEVVKEEEMKSEKMMSNSERESENVIPNSLSPQRFEIPPPRKPLLTSKNSAVPQEVATLSQQFMKVSPICREKSKNLNVIEMVRQSKFSPLTIVPKSNPPVLTSTPKQKSILSYTKSNLKTCQEAVASISTREKSRPCVAFSRLSNAELLCVVSLCNKNLATRQDKFGPEVTHMIVSVDKHNHLKDHTIKFISAIAAGIWILNIRWVQECLAKNYIVDEEPFEVLDITGTPSPRISRLNRLTNPLLQGFKIFIPKTFAQTSADEVKNIIQLLQGEVVSSIEELTSANREEYTCIIISELVDTEDYTQYENWLVSHKLITVDINWLSLSVSRYKILSLRPHLICSDDSIEELGYPSNLVVDVAPTLTQDVTVFD